MKKRSAQWPAANDSLIDTDDLILSKTVRLFITSKPAVNIWVTTCKMIHLLIKIWHAYIFLHKYLSHIQQSKWVSSVGRLCSGWETVCAVWTSGHSVERNQLRWFGHLIRIPAGCLPLEVFQVHPTGRGPWVRTRTRWRDYTAYPIWPGEENVATERDACYTQTAHIIMKQLLILVFN